MALEFTEFGKKLVLWNIFHRGATTNAGSEGTNVPVLTSDSTSGNQFVIQFYSGTRPTLSSLTSAEKNWSTASGGLGQSLTGFSGATKLYPNSTTLTPITTILATGSGSTLVEPTSKLTLDWTNNIATTSVAVVGNNLLFGAGTLAWFAIYAGFGLGDGNPKLAWTGTVGATGSGADIEVNQTSVPSNNYPVQITRLSFKFLQPTGVDLIFNKGIYLTALANILGCGTHRTGDGGVYYTALNAMSSGNTKYASNGTNRIEFYTGTRPATPNTAVSGGNTLIATVDTFAMTYANMTETTSTSEVSLAKTGTNYIGNAVATGNPTWCRVYSNNLNNGTTYAAFDCTAGLPGSGAAIIYQDAVTSGMGINVNSFKFKMA